MVVSTHDTEFLNLLMLKIPMIALVRSRLETFVGCPVQMSIERPEFWRVIPPPPVPPLEEPEGSSFEEGENSDDPPPKSSRQGKRLATADPTRAEGRSEGRRRAFYKSARAVPATATFPVCLNQAFYHNWFVADGPYVRELARPFIAHAVLMLPMFNHLLQAICCRTPTQRVAEGNWVLSQILGSTSPSVKWTVDADGTGSHLDTPDSINIKDNEDVRVWMLAASNHNVLRLCDDFHQVDHLGNQTPEPDYQPYLVPEIYQNLERDEEQIQFGGGKPHTPGAAPAPAPVPLFAPVPCRARTQVPTAGESVAPGGSRGRLQQVVLPPSPIAALLTRTPRA